MPGIYIVITKRAQAEPQVKMFQECLSPRLILRRNSRFIKD